MADMINPYNFVPLGKGPDRSQGYPGKHRLQSGAYNGVLECQLTVLSPLLSADHRTSELYQLRDIDGSELKIQFGRRQGESWKPIEVFRFLRNGNGQPILQGTSIKGMVRSVYEALVDACLPFAATTGKDYRYDDLKAYRGKACKSLENLCAACRLFGVITDDDRHCQGRVRFSDAVLTNEKALMKRRYYLRELSEPKPRHRATYGKNTGNGIAGRKFYYHHGPTPTFDIPEDKSNDRSKAVDELALPGTHFSFRIFIENVEVEEFCRLLQAIELAEGLGHKIGLGKAIGLGSCQIHIDREKSRVSRTIDRYSQWEEASDSSSLLWADIRKTADVFSSGLRQVLRLNKGNDGPIGYPTARLYPREPIDERGIFGGAININGQPGKTGSLRTRLQAKDERPPVKKIAAGQRVQCILLEEKTKKGGWKAKLKDGDGEGAIIPGTEPTNLSPGQEVELIIQSTDPKLKNMSFRWLTGTP